MTIRDDAYNICKSVWVSPSRDGLKSLITRLNASEFGYLARGQHAQLLGFLVIDNKKNELAKDLKSLHIVPLTDEERILLSKAHKQITLLNKKCIHRLASKLPQCLKAINPYYKYNYEVANVPDGDILTEASIDKMATSFSSHPAIQIAIQSLQPPGLNITEEKYIEYVSAFTRNLLKAGVYDSPDDVSRIMLGQNKDSKQRIIIRHIAGLTCIQASLSVLDQLLYQSILSNKLPTLDKNNVIEIGNQSNNLIGNGLSLLYQPGEKLFMAEICELIFINTQELNIHFGQLWQVESLHREYSQDFGSSEELSLREIDENLNPFGHLLKDI